MCPKSACDRLVGIGKDVIYQMFLGMFQLRSPVGLANAAAWSANMTELLNKTGEGLAGIDGDDSKSIAENLKKFK